MKNIFLIFLIALVSLSSTNRAIEHPIYISITEVDYFTKKGEIQVALKVFTDDLELAIRETSDVKLNLDSKKEIEDVDFYLEKYVKNNFQLSSATDNIDKMQYVGKEYEEASIWIYFSFKTVSDLKELKILNKVIIDLHNEQKNIINFRKDRKLIKTSFTNKKSKTITIDIN